MALSIVKCTVEANGVQDDNFDNVSFGSVTKAIPVPLMNKTNHGLVTERYTFTINRVEPVLESAVDLENLLDAVVVFEFDNGKRWSFGGVYTTETGEGTLDQSSAFAHPISCSAESKTVE